MVTVLSQFLGLRRREREPANYINRGASSATYIIIITINNNNNNNNTTIIIFVITSMQDIYNYIP